MTLERRKTTSLGPEFKVPIHKTVLLKKKIYVDKYGKEVAQSGKEKKDIVLNNTTILNDGSMASPRANNILSRRGSGSKDVSIIMGDVSKNRKKQSNLKFP